MAFRLSLRPSLSRIVSLASLVSLAPLAALAVPACGSDSNSSAFDGGHNGGGGGDSTSGGGDSGKLPKSDSSTILHNGDDAAQVFDVEPSALTTLTVPAGTTSPTATFKATVNGAAAMAGWGVDRGDIGSVPPGPSTSAVFTPTGTTGGLVTLTAAAAGQTLTRQILVKLTSTQNGPNGSTAEAAQLPANVAALSAGGGVDGVGGEGLGPAVTDPAALTALSTGSSEAGAQGLKFLYPYDQTVWPRGMLAPLLMWSWTPGDADAIEIELATTSGSFSWTGTFARPAILALETPPASFIRSPIPQDVWNIATNTAGAVGTDGKPDALTVKLTVEKGGVAAGPITETWPVAPGLLTGTVYYNSYATQLVKNWGGNRDAAGNAIGAAILGIRSGDTGPSLVVGENSANDDSGCRVCHVVSSKGRWLITQSEQGSPGDGQSYLYDLTASDVQGSAVALTQEGTFTWAGLVGDGSYALTNSIDPSSSNNGITGAANNTSFSSFWQFGAAPTAATLNGLPANVAAGYPSFSPDDSLVAYVDATGNTSSFNGPIMTAKYASATQTFSDVQKVAAPATGQVRIGYPVFLPDDSGLLYEAEVRQGGDSVMVTRNGARSELWWVALNGGTPTPVRLDSLNGKSGGTSYLPTNANNHGIAGASDPQDPYSETGYDDTTLNYEPTLLPVVSGGYAWVVFTSRRLYGNQLTEVPWLSWPQDYNTTSLAQATVKKLWVAAIDLGDPASADISHPAFYLPAQEILAGNSRGFWVLDPCKANGASCQSGDQCCNGFCEADGEGGALVCASSTPHSCSMDQEKCTTAADCCNASDSCTAGFCAAPIAK